MQPVGPGRTFVPPAGRVLSHLPSKIGVLLGLTVGICVPYFWLQRLELFPLRSLPITPLDHSIPFEPGWIWAYVSIALLVPLAPLLATERDDLRRYCWALTLLCLPCFAIFLLFPVAGPRPEVAPHAGLYSLIASVDRPTNSLPSLHAGLTVLSLLFAHKVLSGALEGPWRAASTLLGAIWGGLILYATLATKQHWLLDLPAGMFLAWGAHALAWRGDRARDVDGPVSRRPRSRPSDSRSAETGDGPAPG